VYRSVARAAVASLTWRERGASAYVRGELGGRDFVPGLSDVDLTIVLAQDPGGPCVAARRVRQRWDRLRRALPCTELLVDLPCIYEDAELGDLAGSSALNYGLDHPAWTGRGRAGYLGDAASLDTVRMLERPGLYGTTAGWRLLSGPERRPPEPARDPQLRRIAAWLELVFWWRQLFPICVDPTGPRPADLCVKCVAEPARIWLWLAHGERTAGRVEGLRRALDLMPDEEDALRRALDLRHALPHSPDSPLAETLPAVVRISARIAGLMDAEAEAEDSTEVRLAGGAPAELVLGGGNWKPTDLLDGGRDPELLPLADWRGLACPLAPDDSFATLSADPRDPAVLRAAAALRDGPYPSLRADGLMIRPGASYLRTRLRAIQCRATDPVSFALSDGKRVAAFTKLRGWSARDTAQRAVAEHRAWLRATTESGRGLGRSQPGGRALAMLLPAARAALFLESIIAGDPELALTMAETARALGARSASAGSIAEEALARYREFVLNGAEPPTETVSAMRKAVLELPPYADS
jgi:hypothetical protein